MIEIHCIDPETKNICIIHTTDYSSVLFKHEIEEKKVKGEIETKDKYFMFIPPDPQWYAVPLEEYENHLWEAEIEGTMELDIELEEQETFMNYEAICCCGKLVASSPASTPLEQVNCAKEVKAWTKKGLDVKLVKYCSDDEQPEWCENGGKCNGD